MLLESLMTGCSLRGSSSKRRAVMVLSYAPLACWSCSSPAAKRLDETGSGPELTHGGGSELAQGSEQPDPGQTSAAPTVPASAGSPPSSVDSQSDGDASFWEEGLASRSPLLNPGKVDLLYRSRPNADEYNLFLWSPLVKAGAGVLDFDDVDSTEYAGGYIRPLQPVEGAGELIIGGLNVDAAGTSSHEVQAEYRLPSGFGLGGGYVSRPGEAADVTFGKATYRNQIDDLSFILEAQAQETGSNTEPGGYLALYDEKVLGVFGHDGEQWRATLNYIFPESTALLRPAIEGHYVDNSIGENDGTQFVFINGTLKYKGGFLSHPAALGRAMGPQGLEYGNPLGFLSPTWNRRLDTWELGNVLNVRAVRNELPNGSAVTDCELIVYALQFDDKESLLDSLLIGGSYFDGPGVHTPGVLLGFSGLTGPFNLSLIARQEFDTGDHTITFGLIDKF